MVSRKVKLLNFESKDKKFYLALKIDGKTNTYEVNITDRAGVFGVEFPDELGLLLRSVPEVSRNIISSVKSKYRELFSARQAA